MTSDEWRNDLEGRSLGAYKVLRQLSEGGVSLLFLAEQSASRSRYVALKTLKQGMDSRGWIRRLETESQVLAKLNHPGIPTLLESGRTDSGRPYFSMQFVNGVPITEYCDKNNVGIRGRLELFSQCCRIVHYVHKSGVIHQDLKPRSMLVMEHEQRTFPQLLGFSVAHDSELALLDEANVERGYCSFVGTPRYASPEQTGMWRLDVDIRSDVYSLGVVLYELLVEESPLDWQKLKTLAFDEVCTAIREADRPSPSDRFDSIVSRKDEIASLRSTTSRTLSRVLRRRLDEIVMKAIDLDKSRRHESVVALANDIDRVLGGESLGGQATICERAKLMLKRRIDKVGTKLAGIPA